MRDLTVTLENVAAARFDQDMVRLAASCKQAGPCTRRSLLVSVILIACDLSAGKFTVLGQSAAIVVRGADAEGRPSTDDMVSEPLSESAPEV